jgi:diguanylate cyclase (GGDEF)-like protein
MGGLATAVRQSMRDTDFPVNQGDRQVMLLLPHTDLKGAHVVARRILFRIARSQLRRGEVGYEPRVSLGYAAASGDALQFSELVREATANLHAAQERGGNCLVPPKP